MRSWAHAVVPFAILAQLVGSAGAGEPEVRAPGTRDLGEVFSFAAPDQLSYEYRLPKDYDPKAGANLVIVLHGSNLDRRWTFANHDPKTFRPHDIVVSPDGTTPNMGGDGFNFRFADKDALRLHALHLELRKVLNVKRTFLYGHSQGSFFALFYAGQYPDFVDGVVAHASGAWKGTRMDKKCQRQAIAFMHGTADPVVPYDQSVASYLQYRDAGYPMVHLRSLEGWNHWPNAQAASEQLDWCAGMTATDADEVERCFRAMLDVEDSPDAVARALLAKHLQSDRFVSEDTKKKAKVLLDGIDARAAAHVQAIEKSMRGGDAGKLDDKPWLGHLRRFLRTYRGLRPCEELREKWADQFAHHAERAKDAYADYQKDRESDPARAFVAGVEVVSKGFLADGVVTPEFIADLHALRDDAKKLKIPSTSIKLYEKAVPVYEEALKKGDAAFGEIERG